MRGLMLLALLLLSSPVCAALIEGRVVEGDRPLSGLRVAAYPSLDSRGTPLALSDPTDEKGNYRLEVPEGYVALYAADPAGGRFAFCGRNPVRATSGQTVWAGLQAVPVYGAVQGPGPDEYAGDLEGQTLFEGKPLAGALAYLYMDVADDLKGQGYRISLPTDEQGYFSLSGLPEGDYFLVVRRRANDERLGPVLEGDLLGVFPGNPLRIEAGRVSRVKLGTVRKLKGESGSETPNRLGRHRLSGLVVDAKGAPVAGLHVFAYTDRVIGHSRPAALSTATGPEGRFELSVDEPGTYYVGARQYYGDSPAPGELFGMYEGSADHGLHIGEKGEQGEVRIEVAPVKLD